ncbi:MAG: ferrous iron transport protein A [Candidatus Heimdallarchaeota archaeon]|nr:ferrous iron transport protein A [Candidatus Heimdallarchaeota archaeon]
MTEIEIDSQICTLKVVSSRPSKPLLLLHVGRKGIVGKILGGRSVCKRLNELGLVPGTEVEMVNRISNGPVMIRVKGSKLALGRGLASKVHIIME